MKDWTEARRTKPFHQDKMRANKQPYKGRKAQTEIVGLLLIVIIISIILVFALVSLASGPEEYKQDYVRKDLSRSMIGAILNTHSGCTEDTLIKDLLIDCARSENLATMQLECDDGRRSCVYAGDTIDNILKDTLEKWHRPYQFRVISPSRQVIDELNSNSTDLARTSAQIDTSTQPLPVGTRSSAMEIWLCIGGPCPDFA